LLLSYGAGEEDSEGRGDLKLEQHNVNLGKGKWKKRKTGRKKENVNMENIIRIPKQTPPDQLTRGQTDAKKSLAALHLVQIYTRKQKETTPWGLG